ncbi:hypothetical protein SAY86_002998 [Trapa natans]|uniref:CAAX amino terminal protease n=1 Tax=Trapa natans TaxID=22666 RepID=A0AAN7LK45_TRANT|nr:hypothetical protein SAY86_002998 [Trapa natans]
MAYPIAAVSLLVQSPSCFLPSSRGRASSKQARTFLLRRVATSPFLLSTRRRLAGFSGPCVRCYNSGEESREKDNGGQLDWPILRRWDVPWQWQTVSLASLACGLSFVLTGLIETAAIPYLGIRLEELSLDEKAEILFVDQGITTAVTLGVLFGITMTFQPLPEDIFRYDLKGPFNLQKGWVVWAGCGLLGAIGAVALIGAAISFFSDETPQRETDALVRLLPLIGSSSTSTACLLGITGILAPIFEETIFRGFFMVSLTKWYGA